MAYTAEDLPELVGKIVDAAIEAQLSWFEIGRAHV